MARIKLGKAEMQRIVDRDLGEGYQVIDLVEGLDDGGVEFLPPDTVIPPIGGAAKSSKAATATPRADDDDDQIIMIEPTGRPSWDHSVPAKVAIISGSTRKIIGAQG